MADAVRIRELVAMYPNAQIVGCSTAGEIMGTQLSDDGVVATAIRFRDSKIGVFTVHNDAPEHSFAAGEELAQRLDPKGLVHVLVLSDGQKVNGSELVRGMEKHLPVGTTVTGGLAGDGPRFQHTFVLAGGMSQEHQVAAIGFYGDHLKVGFGSLGGWDPFGPQRVVTKSHGNVLFELDGQPALELYKRYLGEHAAGLPATGLLFPLSVTFNGDRQSVVRTILSVDEAAHTLTFAGDIPQGAHAQLMKANFDRLVDGAQGAARTSYEAMGTHLPELAILISCVGRKLVLKQRTEEELDAVRGILGPETAMTGFYSYGEISPAAPNASCELHNQTMTITTFSER